MIAVILGGSVSGKSELAEATAVAYGQGNLVYIATMQPFDDESHRKIERHRVMRKDKNFETIECYTGLDNVILQENTTVLLECMSNLTANEMFSSQGAGSNAMDAVRRGVENLMEQADNLVIVTNNVFEDGTEYDAATKEYMQLLGDANRWICTIADMVIESVHGIPVEAGQEAVL